jgi:hypothetical protein
MIAATNNQVTLAAVSIQSPHVNDVPTNNQGALTTGSIHSPHVSDGSTNGQACLAGHLLTTLLLLTHYD